MLISKFLGIEELKKNNESELKINSLYDSIVYGSNFESLLFAAHNNLNNLILIVDSNNLQSLTTVEKTLGLMPYDKKFKSFNWEYYECNGNSISALQSTFKKITKSNSQKPKVIVAKTIKGKGVSFMEGKVEWHYMPQTDDQHQQALEEVGKLLQADRAK